jgi:PBSX family phage terminase large subunit
MNYHFERNFWLKWYWPFVETLYTKEGHYGTRQSAKSHNIARKLIYHSFQPYQFNVIHSRKVYSDIEGSTFTLLTNLIYKNFKNDFIIRKNHFEIINKHTGNWFRGLGMDKAEKGKGVEGANIAWLNEANQFTREDVDYIDTTLRGETGVPISLIMDWNPESINHWLKREVDENKDKPDCLFHKSTFWDNYTIDRDALHERLLRIKGHGMEGERRYKVWALGDWGVEDIDSTFAYSFETDKHVVKGRININPQFEIYLSFDFNVTNTCGVYQFLKNVKGQKYYATINKIKTYRIGDLKILCETIKAEFPKAKFIINGDASGQNKSAFTSDNISAYTAIKSHLQLNDMQIQVAPANPSHIQSRVITNMVLQRCNVRIAEENDLLIEDLKQAQVDRKGSLDPWKLKNPNLSHSLDEFRYFVFTNFNEIANDYEIE